MRYTFYYYSAASQQLFQFSKFYIKRRVYSAFIGYNLWFLFGIKFFLSLKTTP
jgi:hypothetical protein